MATFLIGGGVAIRSFKVSMGIVREYVLNFVLLLIALCPITRELPFKSYRSTGVFKDSFSS